MEVVDHHLSHAASSFYFSGFDEAAILTVDGVGDVPTTTYSHGHGTVIDRFDQVDYPHSLGFLYSAVTGYLGFEVNEGEYRVMGLAPYGRPRHLDALRRLIDTGADGGYQLNLEYFGFQTGDAMFSPALTELLGQAPRQPESGIDQFHRDVARSVQELLEEVMLEKIGYLHRRTGSSNLCLAGGVALNVVANARCLREGPTAGRRADRHYAVDNMGGRPRARDGCLHLCPQPSGGGDLPGRVSHHPGGRATARGGHRICGVRA